MRLDHWLNEALTAHEAWKDKFGPYDRNPVAEVAEEDVAKALAELTTRLAEDNPYFHPRYAGQMQKPPHPAAITAYVAAMLNNPNNHALDGGPVTAAMEREVVDALAEMFGFPTHLGHLTSSGTIANLEALFVARETHPGRGIAYSAESHYTHARMCHVLNMPAHRIPVDHKGRMDLDALEDTLREADIGTVVLTAGTTSLGVVDPIDQALELRARYGFRIHVDAAYGGFHTLINNTPPWQAIARADSVVVDPHKHGLQPYGCGAVVFRDPAVGRFYLHDSPYTYFTSDQLHPGEISLECSRSGAAAAALWFTTRLFPLTRTGLGRVLQASRDAALSLAERIERDDQYVLYQEPELDIVTYFTGSSMSTVDERSAAILHEGMRTRTLYLSTLKVTAAAMAGRHPGIGPDADGARILRSVLMKPEEQLYVDQLYADLTQLVRKVP
jgi:glutamate/tyrosine decarboxylase-like PLP-dependent enzyme